MELYQSYDCGPLLVRGAVCANRLARDLLQAVTHIDRFLDLSDLPRHLQVYYSNMGRPSVDPELMVRMLLVGYGVELVAGAEERYAWTEAAPLCGQATGGGRTLESTVH